MFIEKNFASGVESATFASAKVSKKNWTNQEGFLRVQRSGALRGKSLAETRSIWLMGSEWRIAGFFPKLFKRSCQHRIPYVQRKALRQKCFFSRKNVFDIFFLFYNEEYPDLWQKFSTRVSKTKSTWPEEVFGKTLCGRIYYFKSFDGFCEENLLCKKTPGSSVRHSTRPVEHSKGLISGSNKTFIFFGHWARIVWVFGKITLAVLPKLHSMWPEQLLE